MTSTGVERRPRDLVVGRASGEVGTDGVEDLVILEQAVELLQLGLEVQAELGHEGEQVVVSGSG